MDTMTEGTAVSYRDENNERQYAVVEARYWDSAWMDVRCVRTDETVQVRVEDCTEVDMEEVESRA